jgi:hypothetical protein
VASISHIPYGTVADGKWIRCGGCDKAYWGAFRPTDFIAAKFSAHVNKAHNPDAVREAEAADAAPASIRQPSDHADFVPNIIADCEAQQARNRAALPTEHNTPVDPLVEDALADIAFELDPRLQLGQGPRMFPEEGGKRRKKVVNDGHAAVARAQAALSPLQGWA